MLKILLYPVFMFLLSDIFYPPHHSGVLPHFHSWPRPKEEYKPRRDTTGKRQERKCRDGRICRGYIRSKSAILFSTTCQKTCSPAPVSASPSPARHRYFRCPVPYGRLRRKYFTVMGRIGRINLFSSFLSSPSLRSSAPFAFVTPVRI